MRIEPFYAHSPVRRWVELTTAFLLLFAVIVPYATAATRQVDQGGAGDDLTITDAVTASSDGDTILIAAGTYTEAVSTSKGLVFIGAGTENVSWQKGSSLYYCLSVDAAPVLEVHGIRFTGYGCGIGVTDCTNPVLIADCEFQGMNFDGVAGVGVYSRGQVIEVNSCLFAQCHTTGVDWGPGGLYIHCTDAGSIVANTTFMVCTSESKGGAMRISGTGFSVTGCVFISNTADIGGGVLCEATDSVFQSCTFYGNQATSDGGGFYNDGWPGSEIRNSIFRSNTAGANGGAIRTVAATTSGTIRETIFDYNGASQGGAIYEENFATDIQWNTFYANTASVDGAALFVESGPVDIHNNIFCRQSDAPAIHCSNSPPLGCNDFWDNFAGNVSGCSDPLEADGNIFLDPHFCDAPGGTYELAGDSPCLPMNSPAICTQLIGCFGPTCDETSIEVMSWGTIRALFR